MGRSLYNATVIPEVIRRIAEHFHMDEMQAMDDFYQSETAKALNDPETGLYGQSALFLFSLYLEEKHAKQDLNV